MRTFTILLILLFFPAIGLSQTTWYVPDDFAGIQLAISDASVVNGDTIIVRPGTYVENINFLGKAITLKSELGLEVTVIDGNQADKVVTCESGEGLDSVLDGFTITNGFSDGYGGGMHIKNSSATVTNCTFSENSSTTCGGGMCIEYSSSPTVTNCTFYKNSLTQSSLGGGMFINQSTPAVVNCTFYMNSAGPGVGGYGGGMLVSASSSSPTVLNCTFFMNAAGSGGTGYGGGLSNLNAASPTVINCTFYKNSAGSGGTGYGGGIYNRESSPTVVNCTFYKNSVGSAGVNPGYGGGIFNKKSSPTVINCILWGDTSGYPPVVDEIHNNGSNPSVSYSNIQGGYSGTANIDADPLFLDADNGNLHLGASSPCTDAGVNSAPDLPLYDFDGDDRIIDGDEDGTATVDMGVDECFPASPEVWVDDDWKGLSPGDPVAGHTFGIDAFAKIQYAINMVAETGTVHVADGIYSGAGNRDLDFRGRALTLKSDNGSADCIIDPEQNGRGFYFNNGEDTDSVVDGFTITNGSAGVAGGMHIGHASPTISNCLFSGNSASSGGGGMNIYYASPTISYCLFSGNSAQNEGGGMKIRGSDSFPTVTHCVFTENSSKDGGGIFSYDRCSPTFTHCTFSENLATGGFGGGAIYSYDSSATFSLCTFSGNSATGYDGGGGMCLVSYYNDSFTITNCIFTGNSTNAQGGGLFCTTGSSPVIITNSLFSGNTAMTSGGGLFCNTGSSSVIVTNSSFSGNTAMTSGGGIFCCSNAAPTVTNCMITDNSTVEYGGGIYCHKNSPLDATNCTIANNHASIVGGIYCLGTSHTLTNCIVWGNDNFEIYPNDFIDITITYSNIDGGWPGVGNIEADPLFVDQLNGDYHLTYLSPCRDAGDNAANVEAFDFDGDPRIANGVVDMGADEFYTHFYYTGDSTPGGNIALKFIDKPYTTPVILWLGSGVLDPPIHLTNYGDWRLQFPTLFQLGLGSIPGPDGVLALPLTIPADIPTPLNLPFQALHGSKLTNLCVIEIK